MWDDAQGQIENSEFYLSFLAQTKGLALQSYFVKTLRPEEGVNTDMDNARIRVHNSAKHPFQANIYFEKTCAELRGYRVTEYEIELCRFRFLKNCDSGSSAVFSNLSGIGIERDLEKESFTDAQLLISQSG